MMLKEVVTNRLMVAVVTAVATAAGTAMATAWPWVYTAVCTHGGI